MIGTIFPFRPWWAPRALPCVVVERHDETPAWRFTHWWPDELPEYRRVTFGVIDDAGIRKARAQHDGVYLTRELWESRPAVEWFRDTVRLRQPGFDWPVLLEMAQMQIVIQEIAA